MRSFFAALPLHVLPEFPDTVEARLRAPHVALVDQPRRVAVEIDARDAESR